MAKSIWRNSTRTFVIIISAFLCPAMTNCLHPIILVPGAGGNQLEARLLRDYKPPSLFCNRWYPLSKRTGGWFRLWFDFSVLLPPFTDCFAHRMTLYYDKEADDFRNAVGVETRVPYFGSTRSLLYLDPNLKSITSYMSKMVESLKKCGYTNDKTIFGAPYDFRYGLSADGHPSKVGSKFLEDLRELVEKASTQNEGKPVIIISHSLGGLFVLQFLNRRPLSWRNKYIKHFIALSCPWGGAVQQLLTFASGNTLGIPLVDPLRVRAEQRSSDANLWLLPNPQIFGDRKLLLTPNSSYSARDMVNFLDDIGFPEGVYPYKSRILPLMTQLEAPEVPVTCIIGSGVETAERLVYNERNFDERPAIIYGDGDGTVNTQSLRALETIWAGETNQPLNVIQLSSISHKEILMDERALRTLSNQISEINFPMAHLALSC